MRNFITTFLAMVAMLIFLHHHLVACLSPEMQRIALLHFKQSLNISIPSFDACYSDSNIASYPKTRNWSMSSDHCTWDGVSCEPKTGDVIGLDLSCSQLEGAILPNSTLFQLSHLRSLNLSQNDFSLSSQIPQEFGSFAKGLTLLDLSATRFTGRVPPGISHLHKLVSLDLGSNDGVELQHEVFKSLLQNLTQLRVLNLKWVNISSTLPMNLSPSLRVLNFQDTGLFGVLPQEVFHLPNLKLLELSFNNLTVILPKGMWGSSRTLQHLVLNVINFHHQGIPDSIGFLDSLATLSLWQCNLSGPIPKSLGNLGQLTKLNLDGNNLNGPILKLLPNLTNLMHLSLSHNNFTGSFPSSFVAHSSELIKLDLSYNGFTGPLPPWLLTSTFHQIILVVYWTSKKFLGLEYLEYLDLSHNSLSVKSTASTVPPQLYILGLSSCNMKEFPHFPKDAEIILDYVDLSNNDIDGGIPQWIGSVHRYLNLSRNRLAGGLEQLPWNNIQYLDLQSNILNGSLPNLICNSSSLEVLNLSHNNLSGILPICQSNLTRLLVFDLRKNNIQGSLPSTLSNFRNLKSLNLHGNKLQGGFPSSFAEFDKLETLDLGSNQINDTFPQCLEALPNLQVLVLKSNKFYGTMNKSSEVEHPFQSLRIIDISYNDFSGPLPVTYFRNFMAMMNGEVNKIKRSYMERQYYSDSTNLVIKGHEIQLNRILTVFTTIDLSKNNFEGKISEYTGNLLSLRFLNLSHNHLTGHIPPSIANLTVLESLDLSSNQLEGEIPGQLTGLYSLALLNLSYNKLRGHIPQGFQFNIFEIDSYVGNLGLCGKPLSKKCGHDNVTEEEDQEEDDDYFFGGFTWEAVVIGYGCGVVPAFIAGYLMLLARKPKWFAGIIARELGLKVRRMEIKWR
ncbi:receptor-like protein 7 [Apium graveolens]|uniref:receptor-like protein 7 n=1 Tax=Apium graveolens TaxID=4045 RepID=UPI003D7B4485